MKKTLFLLFIVFMLFSCKTTNKKKQPLEHVGFWVYSNYAYLELKKNHEFVFYWGPYTDNKPIKGNYEVDYNKKKLTLTDRNGVQIWQFEISQRKWIIFLMDLQNYKYTFYKTDKKDFFAQNFLEAK